MKEGISDLDIAIIRVTDGGTQNCTNWSVPSNYTSILDNTVDEIYCSLKELNTTTVAKIRSFSNSNNIVLKLIPDSNKLYSKNQNIEFYDDTLVVLNVKKLPFEFSENYIIKRVFDIIFSIMVCLFILTWLVPILWVLVKIESKGPLIFSQKREGLDGRKFVCYKFRFCKNISIKRNIRINFYEAII